MVDGHNRGLSTSTESRKTPALPGNFHIGGPGELQKGESQLIGGSRLSRIARSVGKKGMSIVTRPNRIGMYLTLRQGMGPSSLPQNPNHNVVSEDVRETVVREVVQELDNEYPPMDCSFDSETARRAAGMAVDKLTNIIQPDVRGEI